MLEAVSEDTGRGTLPDLELSVARCRVLLSVVAILAVYVDPTEPALTSLGGGAFTMHPYTFAVMAAHLVYAVAWYAAVAGGRLAPARGIGLATGADVLFSVLIALVTEGRRARSTPSSRSP
jgi:hypothetical protein